MVASPSVRVVRLALLMVLVASGCSSPLRRALGPAGVKPTPPPARAPTAFTSAYEHAPTLEWGRHAVGRPFFSAFAPARTLTNSSCVAVPTGITRVLPAVWGTEANDMLRLGPLGMGVAGVPVSRADLVGWTGGNLDTVMLERGARLASREGCATDVFAYVRLGLGVANEPVAVLR